MAFDSKTAATATIDLQDWVDDALRDEQIVTDGEGVQAQIAAGVPLSRVARNTVVSRQGGAAPPDILAPNRTLLSIGAYADTRQRYIRTALKQVRAANGRRYARLRFVGPPHAAEPDAEDGVAFQSAVAAWKMGRPQWATLTPTNRSNASWPWPGRSSTSRRSCRATSGGTSCWCMTWAAMCVRLPAS